VTGLDLSQAMLDKLQAKLDQEPREVQARVALKCANMRDYRFSQKFRLVFCASNSFLAMMTTEDQLACLRSVREYLADDGRLVLNIFAPYYDKLVTKTETSVHREKDPETGRDLIVGEITRRNWQDQTMSVCQYVDRIGDDGTVRRYPAEFSLSWIHHREMHLLLRYAGFEVVNVYGGYDKRPYDYVAVPARPPGLRLNPAAEVLPHFPRRHMPIAHHPRRRRVPAGPVARNGSTTALSGR